jgi:hypothetical protein
MTGIYGTHLEDRARERELDRYLDAQAKTIRDEQRYQGELEDQAADAVKDAGDLLDIFDKDPDGFIGAVATLIAECEKRAKTSEEFRDNVMQAYYDFHTTLIEKAKELSTVQIRAENALEEVA